MDEYYKEQQELQAFDKYYYFSKNHFLKRTFQLVLSVSIFSLILCYSSGFSFFPYSFNVYFSTFLFSFFTHTLERKYMFIICNGILAFLAKSSVSCSTSSSSASAAELSASGLSEMKVDIDEEVASSPASAYAAAALTASRISKMKVEEVPVAKVKSSENVVEEEQEQAKESSSGEEKGRESGVFGQEAEEKEDDNESAVTQEEDIAEAEAAVVAVNEPSTEELNKKIEEFIRKMKEEIRIEAQQHLIAV